MEQYLLIKYSYDYADEYDVEGFFVMTANEFENRKNKFKKYFETHDVLEKYCANNGQIVISSYEDFLDGLKTFEITVDEAKRFIQIFSSHPLHSLERTPYILSWGFCCGLFDF